MCKGLVALVATSLVAAIGLTACSQKPAARTPKVGVVLPDQASAVRWETADRPYLEQAFRNAGIEVIIDNAQGSVTQFQTIVDTMLSQGITILMIVNLDSGSGAAALQRARDQGVKTIDYDRLTLNGGADYYVSFDNVEVGRLQGRGLIRCLEEKGAQNPTVVYLNGAPTDNNAKLFRQGYDEVLSEKFNANEYVRGPERDVPDWSGTQAGVLFDQMYTAQNGDIDGVLAANDTLGGAAIASLTRVGLNGRVPVTGQDASLAGLQNILKGDQCMTVYKAIEKEANAAAELAIALATNQTPANLTTVRDTEANRDVPSRLEIPQAIFRDNINVVVEDGFVDRAELCAGEYAQYCTELGL